MVDRILKDFRRIKRSTRSKNCLPYIDIWSIASFYQLASLVQLSSTRTLSHLWTFNHHSTTFHSDKSSTKSAMSLYTVSFVAPYTCYMWFTSHCQSWRILPLLTNLLCTFFTSLSFQSLSSDSNIILGGNWVSVQYMLRESATMERENSKGSRHAIRGKLKAPYIWGKKCPIGTLVLNFGSEDAFIKGRLLRTRTSIKVTLLLSVHFGTDFMGATTCHFSFGFCRSTWPLRCSNLPKTVQITR